MHTNIDKISNTLASVAPILDPIIYNFTLGDELNVTRPAKTGHVGTKKKWILFQPFATHNILSHYSIPMQFSGFVFIHFVICTIYRKQIVAVYIPELI